MDKLKLIAPFIIVITGCSSISPIEKENESESHFKDAVYEGKEFYTSEEDVEGDRYRIFHQASTGFSGTSGIRRSAENRAKNFCKKMDSANKMIKLAEHTASPPYILGNFPRIEIIFVCANKETITPTSWPSTKKYDDLSKIKVLFDQGVLTQEEFDAEKTAILNEK